MSLLTLIKDALKKRLPVETDQAVLDEMAKEAAAIAEAEAKAGQVTPPTTPAAGMTAADMQRIIEQQLNPIKEALAKSETAREKAEKALADQEAARKQSEIDAIVQKAVADGKIAPAQEDLKKGVLAMAATDLEGAKKFIDALPAAAKPADINKPGVAPAANPAATPLKGDQLRAASAAAFDSILS